MALDAGQVVSTDQILDDVWGDGQASTALKQVHIVVSKLRKLLSSSHEQGREIIETVPRGYRLNLPPALVDVHRFADLVRLARTAQGHGDIMEAAALMSRALATWRGTALADVMAPWARIEATRLEGQRLTAVEELTDLRLALGEHEDVVPSLVSHVGAHPLRERARAQLMLALYRSGRIDGALGVYAETRRVLVTELGIEPGVELRRLQQAILARDAELTTTPSGQRIRLPPHGDPAGLPTLPSMFTARTTELTEVLTRLAPSAVVAINGAGGVGKSTLAVRAAQDAAPRFADGVLYVDLHGATPGRRPLSPTEALNHLLTSIGLGSSTAHTDIEDRIRRYRSATSRRNLLVVLDNARDARQCAPLIPTGHTSATIITSRRVLGALDRAQHLRVARFEDEDAVLLLARLAGNSRVAAEPDSARQIVRLSDGLPLALRAAAAQLTARPEWGLADLAARLADTDHRLDALQHDHLSVRASIATSHQALSDEGATSEAQHLFRLLGLLNVSEVPLSLAAALAGWPEDRAEGALNRLVDAQLLESVGTARFRIHELVRLYAREQIGGVPHRERAAALRRALRHYTHVVTEVSRAVDFTRKACDVGGLQQISPAHAQEAIAQLDQRLNHFLAMGQRSVQTAYRGRDEVDARDRAACALNRLALAYYRAGRFDEALACLDSGLASAGESGRRRDRGHAPGEPRPRPQQGEKSVHRARLPPGGPLTLDRSRR
jgi:DNA-binding SARP family transcriptional activator